jgi:hypothetical protein
MARARAGRRRAAAVMAATALWLAGCGGGVSLGFQIGDDFDDGNPSVELAADRDTAAPGDPVMLIAAASDASGIDRVTFYRLRADGSRVQLGSDGGAPYRLGTTLPLDADGVVRFVARATDGFGRQADSGAVSITVEP